MILRRVKSLGEIPQNECNDTRIVPQSRALKAIPWQNSFRLFCESHFTILHMRQRRSRCGVCPNQLFPTLAALRRLQSLKPHNMQVGFIPEVSRRPHWNAIILDIKRLPNAHKHSDHSKSVAPSPQRESGRQWLLAL
jgi:hypothetical protein